jgi:hypothetical protein
VLRHHRLADRAVGLHDAHLEDVHETDGSPRVGVDINLLRAPRLVRRLRLVIPTERRHFQEIERDAIGAGHRKNRAAIALEVVQSFFLELLPRR